MNPASTQLSSSIPENVTTDSERKTNRLQARALGAYYWALTLSKQKMWPKVLEKLADYETVFADENVKNFHSPVKFERVRALIETKALDEAEALSEKYEVPVSCSIAMPPCLFDVSRYKRLTFGFCAAGTERAYYTIDPVGNVRPCNHTPTILGNIREKSFRKIVEGLSA